MAIEDVISGKMVFDKYEEKHQHDNDEFHINS